MADVKRFIPLIVACSLFMEQLDSTIIATALPTIARDIDVDPLRLNLGTINLYSSIYMVPRASTTINLTS